MSPKTSHALVALKLPSSLGKLLVLAKAVLSALTSNKATFPSPVPTLAVFAADVDAFDKATTAAKGGPKGAVATRDEKRQAVIADLHQIVAYVQQVANTNPAQATSIIEAAGLAVRRTGSRSKPELALKGGSPGSVVAVAKASKEGKAHLWQVSSDGGKTWANVAATTKAKATLGNLPSGTVVYVRHASVSKGGTSDWSAAVSTVVP